MNKSIVYVLICLLLLLNFNLVAQTVPDLPRRTATISVTQTLNFGDITIISGSNGGTVILSHAGARDKTGDVVLLSMGSTVQQAIFEYKLCPGRSVTINYADFIYLDGSSGGKLKLHIGPTNLGPSGTTFMSNKGCDESHLISVGGTLDIGPLSANPPGLYTGSFSLTFIQQ